MPWIGEAHAARRADEELSAEVGLERLQARGQGRLGDEEGGRRLADALALGRLDERRNLIEEHV